MVGRYSVISFNTESYVFFRPGEDAVNGQAYIQALDAFKPGDACVIFTPDDTHFPMALEAIRRGIHVMITKPAVKTLAEHRQLYEEAQKKNVLVMIEGLWTLDLSFDLASKLFSSQTFRSNVFRCKGSYSRWPWRFFIFLFVYVPTKISIRHFSIL